MKLQTVVPIAKPHFSISHQDKILSIGSCFAQNMASFFEERKFQIQSNPFGIIYNPLSIAKGLEMILNRKQFTKTDLFFHRERWRSFHHHSVFAKSNPTDTISAIKKQLDLAHHQLLNARILIITFGTAYVYFDKKDQQPVANCHQLPAIDFDKKMITVETIIETIGKGIEAIKAQNPNLQIIFTISPIRHIRDGFIENQQSKATLVLAVKNLLEQLENAFYFPSYELVLDELRDYRFYAEDMVHLNETGLNYVWQKFENTFFDTATLSTSQQFVQLRKAMQHRPFNEQSEAHQRFLKKYLELTQSYQQQFPVLDFKEEISYFTQKSHI